MTPERFERITSVLQRRQPDLTVVSDEVHKGRNLSAIIRTCDAVGIDTIHCVVPKDGFQTYGGTAASAEKWVEVEHHADICDVLTTLKAQGHQVVAASLGKQSVDFRCLDFTLPTALVMGAEIKGVSEAALDLVDHRITVPMVGMVESFNVSVACAIILMEAQRQREHAGLYSAVRLDADVYDHRFFNWAHPVLAKYCDDNGLSYPTLRDDGEVEGLSSWYKKTRHILNQKSNKD